jgi:pilus assembly protein Flp/PilA
VVKYLCKRVKVYFASDRQVKKEDRFFRGDNMKTLVAYFKDESGQTSTEYILLVAVVAMIIFRFKSVASARLLGVTNTVINGADDIARGITSETGN